VLLSTRKIPAHGKAHATGRWAETIFRALSSRIANRWKFVSFRGANGCDVAVLTAVLDELPSRTLVGARGLEYR
jgi:hypothetical protein